MIPSNARMAAEAAVRDHLGHVDGECHELIDIILLAAMPHLGLYSQGYARGYDDAKNEPSRTIA